MKDNNRIICDMKERLKNILNVISWREIAHSLGKSSSELYRKMNGDSADGGVGGFTPEEAEELRKSLLDLSDRIRKAAERI